MVTGILALRGEAEAAGLSCWEILRTWQQPASAHRTLWKQTQVFHSTAWWKVKRNRNNNMSKTSYRKIYSPWELTSSGVGCPVGFYSLCPWRFPPIKFGGAVLKNSYLALLWGGSCTRLLLQPELSYKLLTACYHAKSSVCSVKKQSHFKVN